MIIKGKYRKIETAFEAVKKCLKQYYRIDFCKRNTWRYEDALKLAKKQLNEKGKVNIEGAQWGSKWGNYKRRVALNNKGVYEYVEGFNTNKELGF